MFNKKLQERIEELEQKNKCLEEAFAELEQKFRNLDGDLNKDLGRFNNTFDKRLVEFSKEITDKYFSTLERILRVHTESSLVTALAHQVNQKDLNNLKSSLMQPFLEARWENEKKEDGKKIINKGEKIIEERNRLYADMLQREKQGENIDKIKEQLKGFDWILGEIK